MRKKKTGAALPLPVARALRKLGHDIKDARRRIPSEIAAKCASLARSTPEALEFRQRFSQFFIGCWHGLCAVCLQAFSAVRIQAYDALH